MNFTPSHTAENLGKRTGFLIMYFISATLLYIMLKLLKKLPQNWSYFHVLLITLAVALFGVLLREVFNK